MLHSVDLCAYFADGFALSALPAVTPGEERSASRSLSPNSAAPSGLSGALSHSHSFSHSHSLSDSHSFSPLPSLPPGATALRSLGPSGAWAETARGAKNETALFALLQETVRFCYAAEDRARDRCDCVRYVSGGGGGGGEFANALAFIRAQQWRRSDEVRRAEKASRDAARAKELPQLVEDAVRYAQQLLKKNSSGALALADSLSLSSSPPVSFVGFFPEDQMLYVRFPPPLFRAAPFSAGVSRLLRWLRTWHEPMDRTSGNEYRDAWLRISQSDSVCLSHRLSPCRAPDDVSAAYYDQFGNRLRSARLAQKMANQRAVEAEAEATRARRRGYFSRADETNNNGRLAGRRAGHEDVMFAEYSSGSDEGSDAADEDVTNIAVLHGPCGVGKTAAVYLAAAVLGYRVVEMNTSVRRCPKNIDRIFAELTRSRRLSGRADSGKAMVSIEEELKKLKSEHAAAAAAAAAAQQQQQKQEEPHSPSPAKRKSGGKGNKGNAISAAAIAAFFKPKPMPTEVIDVDDGLEKPRAVAMPKTESRENACGTRKRRRECTTTDTSEVKGEKVESTNTQTRTTSASSTPVSTISNNISGGGGGADDDATGRTLLLFEDADVILGDESMRPFYVAVRNLAQRSKVPIVVTVSSGTTSPAAHTTLMGAAQAAHYFGKQTPFAGMGSMPRSALVAQLVVVAAVERGLLACSPANASVGSPDSSSSLSCVTVTDVETFRRISDALRREVYAANDETHIDVRMWLNRLHCLLLCDQWPDNPVSRSDSDNSCSGCARSEEKAENENSLPWFMPTRAAVSLENNDFDQSALFCSEWDARRGRALSLDCSPVASPWEWTQFHYAEEILSRGSSLRNGSSQNHANGVSFHNTSSSSGSHCVHGTGGDGVSDVRGFTGDANADVLCNTMASADPLAVLSLNNGKPPVDDLSLTLREQAEKWSVDGEMGVSRCSFTTRERIETFGHWWRRTRRGDATRSFVAGRSGTAYEDVIGFGSLLQPVSTGRSP